MEILVVDDDKTFLDKMEKTLRLDDHSVVTAQSGEKALAVLEEKEFHLILMDLKMPGLSGIELIREIRKREINSVILMITGYGTIESAVQAMKAGAYDYISKPFDRAKLREKIDEVQAEIQLRKNIIPAKSMELEVDRFIEPETLMKYKSPYLVISNKDPNAIRKQFHIKKASLLWMTFDDEKGAVSPNKLHILKNYIEDFVKQNDEGTIIFVGIEELLEIHEWNDFKAFLTYLKSKILSTQFSLLILVEKMVSQGAISYPALLHDALSLFINPTFHNIIELLSHPLRKNIIRLLHSKGQLNFNRIIHELQIKRSSSLAFHLNKLKDELVLDKEENGYVLSARGMYLADLIHLLEKLGFFDPKSQIRVYNYLSRI
jgi:CheY-like chemotaxis protein